MARLGLSDSMRSTVSLEDTEPLHAATHRRPPRRPRAEPSAAAENASTQQQTHTKAASFVLSNPMQIILGGILCIVLLSTSVKVVGSPLRAWASSTWMVNEQFEQLDSSILLLERDSARLKSSADKFLQSCTEAQVAASTRTNMLQNVAKRSFYEQAKTQMQEHEQVMKEVLQYYAQQEKTIQETKNRLAMMNITLPVQMTVRVVPESWQEEQRRGQGAVEEISILAEKTLQQDGNDNQQLSVESSKSRVEQSTSYGSLFFYVLVACASAVYLRSAVLDARQKELVEDKWSWSPVPKVLRRLKALLGSVVVIEDLRTVNSPDDTAYSLQHIEHIEL